MLEKIKNKCKSTSLRYSYFSHIDEIPEAEWNLANSKNTVFLSLEYLKTLEDTLSETIRFKYIIFYQNQTPVAIAATQLIKFNSAQLKFHEFPCRISDAIKNTLFKNLDVKVLVCGNLFSCGEHGFVYNSDKLSPQDAFESLSNALREIRKSENTDKPSFILLKEFWPHSFSNSDNIKEHDFREFKIDVNMVLNILPEWNTFDDYLSSMRTKFRTRAKKVFKKSEKISVKDFTAEDIDTYKNQINTLYLSVIEKADFKIGKLNASTFKRLKETLNESFILKGYFLNETLVGFTTAFILENAVDANHIGIDYEYNKAHDIYQKMLYDYVDLAISKNTKELRLGRTAEIIKSCVGAKPVEMKLYVRHGNSISNTLLKPLVELISPNEYEVRNPFKLQLD
ncbi:peptidogalycan biosysnthesis protein [Aquimarina mytili]|uniref:N-acetyltransferase n=1 Tax=Aquimarina mytili TaxID=874423 RepID=A0A936ZN70_9FLAO|nr:peptidogalycan biosysnthesis protein [Aquimarina mytili]MBL0682709.1 N-acetyltransferase [Aquimarina mytili]